MPKDAELDRYRDTLESAKRASALQLLFRAARLSNELAVERIRARGRAEASMAHTAVLPHIDLEGTRITEIARRMGISKQAVNQTVGELERIGFVKRAPDPTDGRARLVRFTARGRRELLAGLEVLGTVQSEIAQAVGAKRVRRLHDDLLVLVDWLEAKR